MGDVDSDSDDDLWEIKPVTPTTKRHTNHDRSNFSAIPFENDENKQINGPPAAQTSSETNATGSTAVTKSSHLHPDTAKSSGSEFDESRDSSAEALVNTPHRPFWKVSTTSNSNLLSPATTPNSDRRSNSPSTEDEERRSSAQSDRTPDRRSTQTTDTPQTASVPIDAQTLNKWTHMKRELIHRVGMDEHHRKFVMQYMPDGSRPYYRMYLPQETQFQLDNFLYCRKKRKRDKFRLSLSEKMTKKGNALYEGKLTMISSNQTERAFRLTDRHGRILAEMNTIVWPEAHRVDVLIFPQDAESPKHHPKPIELVGFLQPHIDPRLTLKHNGEPVFEILHPSDHESQARNRLKVQHQRNSRHDHPTRSRTHSQDGGDKRSSRARMASTPRAQTDGASTTSTRRKAGRAASVPQNTAEAYPDELEDKEHSRGDTYTHRNVANSKRASDRSKRLAQKRTQSYQGNRQNKFTLEWKSPLSMFTSFAIACAAEDCIQAEAKNGGNGSYFVDGKKGSG